MSTQNEIVKVFSNTEFGSVRTIEEDGKVLFCGSDVAKALGYTDTDQAIRKNCRWASNRRVPHPQSPDKEIEMKFIPEGDVYRLIVKSRLPAAEKFESWLFDEVVPQIRKTGGYIPVEENMSDLEIVCRALQIMQNTVKQKDELIAVQQEHIDELEPKGAYFDKVLQCKEAIPTTVVAKDYDMSPQQLNKFLESKGIQYKCGKTWVLNQKYAGHGYTRTWTNEYETPYGTSMRVHMYWTQKGRWFIYTLLRAGGILPLAEREEKKEEKKVVSSFG